MTANQSIEAPVTPDQDQKLAGLIAEQEAIFIARQPESARLAGTARVAGRRRDLQLADHPPAGRCGSATAQGSKIYDVDGNEYVDLHGGYGASLAGHAHPAIVAAPCSAQVARGTHFAQPTENAIVVAEELTRRFGLPQWRFGNSGTEATMDAVHLMRAITGRDLIIKVEGGYHGHHDSVQVSVVPEPDEVGPADAPAPRRRPAAGIPEAITDLTLVVGFNDLASVRAAAGRRTRPGRRHDRRADHDERRHHPARARLPGRAQGPAARPRRAADLRRGQDRSHRRTGRCHRARAASRRTSSAWPRPSAAASPSAAVGGTDEVMAHVANGGYEMVGTFNGNPLAMAATRAMLTEVATPEAYARIDALRQPGGDGIEARSATMAWPPTWSRSGPRAAWCSAPSRCATTAASSASTTGTATRTGSIQHNGGVFLPPWGKIEQWLISVQHDEADIDRFVANFARFAAAVAA